MCIRDRSTRAQQNPSPSSSSPSATEAGRCWPAAARALLRRPWRIGCARRGRRRRTREATSAARLRRDVAG
eukprot:2522162-Pyramimonas_sp.AAC.1